MPPRKFFTQEQIDNAKLSLSELPDLTPDRISRDEMLQSISGDIIELSSKKGYTASDIKEALEKIDIQVSEKSISEISEEMERKQVRIDESRNQTSKRIVNKKM